MGEEKGGERTIPAAILNTRIRETVDEPHPDEILTDIEEDTDPGDSFFQAPVTGDDEEADFGELPPADPLLGEKPPEKK